jgi:hypothetical protein
MLTSASPKLPELHQTMWFWCWSVSRNSNYIIGSGSKTEQITLMINQSASYVIWLAVAVMMQNRSAPESYVARSNYIVTCMLIALDLPVIISCTVCCIKWWLIERITSSDEVQEVSEKQMSAFYNKYPIWFFRLDKNRNIYKHE